MRALIILLVFPLVLDAQVASKFYVRFTDKNGSPYSINNPSAFLSSRAIARRTRQNIPIVSNDLPVNPAYINAVLSTGSVTLLNRSRWLNEITILTTDQNALNAIRNLSFVVKVDSVARKPHIHKKFEEFADSSGLGSGRRLSKTQTYDYGAAYNQVHMIGADCMHSKGFDGQGMVIAILDAGFNNANIVPAFDSLRVNNQILGTWDFVSGDPNVYDDDSHGESVLSCIGANIPGQMIGTAPKASFWLLRTEDAFTENVIEEHNWVAGAEFADSVGADIINSSLGYTEFDSVDVNVGGDSDGKINPANHTYADLDGNTAIASMGADIAASKGILVVNSAGNEGNSAWYYLSVPSDGDSVLAVGAVDANENYVGFSSHGPTADGDVKPNVAAQGLGTIVSYSGGGLGPASGTSFSSPLMAGAAASLWQAHPNATNMEIFNAIQKSATHSTNPDSFLGYGIPDICKADNILNGPTGLFPNPYFQSFQFNYYSSSEQELEIELFDLKGSLIFSERKTVAPNSTISLLGNSFAAIAKGFYILRIKTPTQSLFNKVCKL